MCGECTRRSFLLGSMASAMAVPAFGQSRFVYCSWAMSDLQQFQKYSTSGNSNVDHAMIAEIRKILDVFPIDPGFKFIRDDSPNAFAVAESDVPNTRGTVYIGKNLINDEFTQDQFGGVAVAGICAHECGHIFQYDNGYMQSLHGPTAQWIELHADYLAGFYLGKDGSHSRDHVEIFANSLFRKGDFDFNNERHHGTPDQRVAAMREGYGAGQAGTDVRTAAQNGASFVRGL